MAVDIAHKTVVLQCVQLMCENGQLLVDLFVNYDCDLEGANLFERMVGGRAGRRGRWWRPQRLRAADGGRAALPSTLVAVAP